MGAQRTTPHLAVIATCLLTHTGVPPHSVYDLAQVGVSLSFESFVPQEVGYCPFVNRSPIRPRDRTVNLSGQRNLTTGYR